MPWKQPEELHQGIYNIDNQLLINISELVNPAFALFLFITGDYRCPISSQRSWALRSTGISIQSVCLAVTLSLSVQGTKAN